MAVRTRTVTGNIRTLTGGAWTRGGFVTFKLSAASFVVDAVIPARPVKATIDPDTGDFAIDLWCNDDGFVSTTYEAEYPNGEQSGDFVLAYDDGSDIELSVLLILDIPPSNPSSDTLRDFVLQVMATHIAATGNVHELTPDELLGEAAAAGAHLRSRAGQPPEWVQELLDNGGQVVNAHHPAYGLGSAVTEVARSLALQAAADAVAVNGGGVLSITVPGTYALALRDGGTAIDRCLSINASNTAVHVGPGVSVKMADGQLSGAAEGHVIAIGDGVTPLSNIAIFGEGWIDGNEANNVTSASASGACGIRSDGPISNQRYSIGIRNTTGAAIRQTAPNPGDAVGVWMEGMRLENVGEGLVVNNCVSFFIRDIMLDGVWNLQDGIETTGEATDGIIDGIYARGVTGSVIDIYNGAKRVTVSNVFADQTGIGGVIPVVFVHGAHAGAEQNETDDITLDNIIVLNAPNNAVVFQPSASGGNMRLKANNIRALSPGGVGVKVDVEDGIKLTGVKLSDITVDGAGAQGVLILGDKCEITGGNITNCASQAVEFGSLGGTVVLVEGGRARHVTCSGNAGDGIKVTNGNRVRISVNDLYDNNTSGASGGAAIKFNAGNKNRAFGNNCFDTREGVARTQRRGVNILAGVTNTTVRVNYFDNHLVENLTDNGTDPVIRGNDGYDSAYDLHPTTVGNPHNTTAAQVGAPTVADMTTETGNVGTAGLMAFAKPTPSNYLTDNTVVDICTVTGGTNASIDVWLRYRIRRSDSTAPAFAESGEIHFNGTKRISAEVMERGQTAKIGDIQNLQAPATLGVTFSTSEPSAGVLKISVNVDNGSGTNNVRGFFDAVVSVYKTATGQSVDRAVFGWSF